MTLPDRALQRQATLVVETVDEVRQAVAQGHPADATLAYRFRRHPEFGSRDRRLLSNAVFAVLRWQGWLGPERAPDTATACVLATWLDGGALPPAIALLATRALAGASFPPLPADLPLSERAAALAAVAPAPPLSPDDLVPAWALDRIPVPEACTDTAFRDRLIATWQASPPTWLRLRGPEAATRDALQAAGIDTTRHATVDEAVCVRRGTGLKGLPPALRRQFEIQDLASQAVGRVCAPEPGQCWWDACSGSGGKTLHLADLMNGRGSLLATDVRDSILQECRRRLGEAGRSQVAVRRWDGCGDAAPLTGCDGVLLDAPCSGLGTWHRNPDARWRTPEARVDELAGIQGQLLCACAPAVKPGGTLVYATCTLTRTENEQVVAAFLATHADFVLSPFANPLTGARCGGQLTLHPWEGPCNGMFVARLARH